MQDNYELSFYVPMKSGDSINMTPVLLLSWRSFGTSLLIAFFTMYAFINFLLKCGLLTAKFVGGTRAAPEYQIVECASTIAPRSKVTGPSSFSSSFNILFFLHTI